MIKTEMSYHAKHDRLERLAACIEKLGCGDYVLEVSYKNTLHRLTSTGLVLVFGADREILITGYMATISKCTAMYKKNGYAKIPQEIKRVVIRNEKLYSFLLDM